MYNVEENFTRYMKNIGSDILFSKVPGETIKKVRKSIEISQGELARLLDLRRETVSRIETGAIAPTSSVIKRFSKTAAIIKVFREMNAMKDADSNEEPVPYNPTFIRTHFSLSSEQLDELKRIGDTSYNKTKNKILRRIKI
jgi:transcriptional regulator with XRE-family HTH domain